MASLLQTALGVGGSPACMHCFASTKLTSPTPSSYCKQETSKDLACGSSQRCVSFAAGKLIISAGYIIPRREAESERKQREEGKRTISLSFKNLRAPYEPSRSGSAPKCSHLPFASVPLPPSGWHAAGVGDKFPL